MIWIYLFYLPIVHALLQSQYDAPPRIIFPANLDDPSSLSIIGNISELSNSLRCTASNADHIEWKYSEKRDGEKEPMHHKMRSLGIKQDPDTLDLSVTITDKDNTKDRWRINGYYTCVASNRRDYIIQSPPIRLVIPAIEYKSSDIIYPRIGDGGESAPYSMKCIDEEQVDTYPKDITDWNVATYYWETKTNVGAFSAVVEDSRVKVNRVTGDLYFAYLLPGDGFGTGNTDTEYICNMGLADHPNKPVVSRHKLRVTSSPERTGVHIAYPSTPKDKKVSCTDGKKCTLACIYSGRDWDGRRDPPEPEWRPPSKDIVYSVSGSTVTFTAFKGAEGTWFCGAEGLPAASIEVKVLMYPKLIEGAMDNQFVTIGEDAVFDCDGDNDKPVTTDLYVGGVKVNTAKGVPPHVRPVFGREGIKIPNAQKEHSNAVTCIVSNDAGIKYKVAELNVYAKPNITVSPEQLVIKEYKNGETKNITKDFWFDCTATVDPKVEAAFMHWRTDLDDLSEQKLRTGKHEIGLKVTQSSFRNNTLSSRITFLIDKDSQLQLLGYNWRCVLEMKFHGQKTVIVKESAELPFDTANTGGITPITQTAGFGEWWIIGVVVAIFFFILIIILIVCCMKHQKGEKYYVDEKERMAGHNPEEEMDMLGFSDYKRPDQDPIKGSRQSLDMSTKPLDSDSEGMDEYGDIDPGRFNEDGSFIGQYGKASSPMDV